MIYEGSSGPKTAITVLIVLFALSIFGFYLIYNFFGACGKDKMSPVGDSEYIKDQQGKLQTTDKEIAELEASEAHQKEQQQQLQQQQTAAGYVPSPEEQKAQDEELEHTEKQLADAEDQREELEKTLKTAEKEKEWLIFGNVILENRGIWLVKYAEKAQGALVQAKNAVKAASEKLQDSKAFVIVNMHKCEADIASLLADKEYYTDEIWWNSQMALLGKNRDKLNADLAASERELASATKKLADLETALEPAAAH